MLLARPYSANPRLFVPSTHRTLTMTSSPFIDRLRDIQAATDSVVCVGLDPDPEQLPNHLTDGTALPHAMVQFNTAIVEATAPVACAFKINFAFYEALGTVGWRVLQSTLDVIPDDRIVIADAKRADIGNSARFYAHSVFETLGCDACTVSPYMGRDSVMPFLQRENTAAFVLTRTSNPGGADFQTRSCDGVPLFARVAEQVGTWSTDAEGTGGLVVGAPDADALASVRETCPSLPILVPGVGAQGGDPGAVMEAAATDEGPVLVNSSRSILYASDGRDFDTAASAAADELRQELGT